MLCCHAEFTRNQWRSRWLHPFKVPAPVCRWPKRQTALLGGGAQGHPQSDHRTTVATCNPGFSDLVTAFSHPGGAALHGQDRLHTWNLEVAVPRPGWQSASCWWLAQNTVVYVSLDAGSRIRLYVSPPVSLPLNSTGTECLVCTGDRKGRSF